MIAARLGKWHVLGKKVIMIDPRNQQVIYQVAINNQKDTNMSESPSIGLDLLGNWK